MAVANRRFHARELERLTGLVALEGQARLLLNDLREYQAWLESTSGGPSSEQEAAERWLRDVLEPSLDAILPAVGASATRSRPTATSSRRSGSCPSWPATTSGSKPRSRRTSRLGAPAPEDDRGTDSTIALDIDWSGGLDTPDSIGRLSGFPRASGTIRAHAVDLPGGWPGGRTPDDDPVIRVRGLVKRYGDLVAVDGIDFEVARGEVFGLLGPNGAGKTTTVEILEGLREPDGGTATVLGIDVATGADALKPRIGVSLQTAALYPKLTVTELIDLFRSFYPKARSTERADRPARARRAAQRADPGAVRRPAPAAGVALALVNDPELDLPRRADDRARSRPPGGRSGTSSCGLKAKGRTVLLTTHYMEEAEILCDRLAIMDHGQILEMGTVDELVGRQFQERAVRFDAIEDSRTTELSGAAGRLVGQARRRRDLLVYTRDVGATIGALLALAEARASRPQNLAVRRATLEDVFLDLTGRALRD